MGGTLALHARSGYNVAIVDLTAGELATNGDPASRQREAERAARIIGLKHRENLHLPDGRLSGHDEEQVARVVSCLRRLRPRVVLYPVGPDRHPDHQAAQDLVTRAIFMSGLDKYHTGDNPSDRPFRPLRSFGYLLHARLMPDLVVDVSSVYDIKRQALAAFDSQFGASERVTYINQESFLGMMEGRDRYFGGLIGTIFGEGLIAATPLPTTNLLSIS